MSGQASLRPNTDSSLVLAAVPVAFNGLGLAAAGLAAMLLPSLDAAGLLLDAGPSPSAVAASVVAAHILLLLAALAWCTYVVKILKHPHAVLREALAPTSASALGTLVLTTIAICGLLPAPFALPGELHPALSHLDIPIDTLITGSAVYLLWQLFTQRGQSPSATASSSLCRASISASQSNLAASPRASRLGLYLLWASLSACPPKRVILRSASPLL